MDVFTTNSSSMSAFMDGVTVNVGDIYRNNTPTVGAFPGRPPPPSGAPPGGPPGAPPPPNGPPPSVLDYKEPRTIHFVSLGIVIPLSFIFNIISFVVFARSRKLRNTTTGHYLLALATADTLFLIGEFIRWLNTPGKAHLGVHIDFLDRVDSLCRIVMWLRYGSKLASAWVTVVITVERFVTVAFPLRVFELSTPKIAKIVIAAVFLFSFAGGAFPLWTVGVQNVGDTPICLVTDNPTYNIFNWIFLRAVSLFIPGALIIVFCILIAVYLSRAKKVRNRKLSTSSVTSTLSSKTLQRQLTVMLLAVSVAFISLRLPYTVAYYVYTYRTSIYGDRIDPMITYKIFYAMKMTDILVSINHGINFFLYYWCVGAFRRQLKTLFCRQTVRARRHSQDTNSSMTSSRNDTVRSEYVKQVELSPNDQKLTMTSPQFDEEKL